MSVSLQKANFWKRISAFIFDMILVAILAVGAATALSAIFCNKHYDKLEEYRAQYERDYEINLDITDEQYELLTEEEKARYQAASDAFEKDKDVLEVYGVLTELTLGLAAISMFISYFVFYFVIPLLLRNGRTLGKKIFGLAVIRTSCVKISNPILFIRSMLGQYVIEAMVPAFLALMFFSGIGIGGIVAVLLLVLEIVVVIVTKNTRSTIHDLLSDTVVVDFASQRIFESQDELIAYKQEQHAAEVAKPESANESPDDTQNSDQI